MRHARTNCRGFTLAELLVYISLVSAGILLIGGVELFAQRSLHMQQSLIEVELQTVKFGGLLRQDVEAARSIRGGGEELQLVTLAGERVRYRPGERATLDAAGEVIRVDEAPEVKACTFTVARLPSGRARVDATLEFELRFEGELRTRTRTRTALSRLAVTE